MMPYFVTVLPEAENDISAAFHWYEKQLAGLGDQFLDEIITFFQLLEQNPEVFGWYNSYARRAVMKRFPFIIIFELAGIEVIVNSVFHTSRNPIESNFSLG